jgi:uncharacterized protein YbjT (DUF2867 family)
MRILLTGATGYIGKRLLPILVKEGHQVVCCVRDADRFNPPDSLKDHLEIVEVDFLKEEQLTRLPKEIDAAYYLIHSMSGHTDYRDIEKTCAEHFVSAMNERKIKQVIYLSGMVNEEELSTHLESRLTVENTLEQGDFSLTTLRAGIIIGSGSASFEIIRDLVEKLPVMVAPKWINTRCQPIAIRDVIRCLTGVLGKSSYYDRNFDIGGPDILTYREMLMGFAKERKLWRKIVSVPVMTPKLSSYWLYFVTSTTYKLASSLVESMTVEVVARDNQLLSSLNIEPLSYNEALKRSFMKIRQNEVVSSWKDSMSSGVMNVKIADFIQVPEYGCFRDYRSEKIQDAEETWERVWKIGGSTGWYYATWLWRIRGFLDRMVGGVGLRRGRTEDDELSPGDALDFWRVMYASRDEKRLLLYAEMKLPGDAWLEFKIEGDRLIQHATFRPKGVWGRIYWFSVLPFHGLIFNGMLRQLAA